MSKTQTVHEEATAERRVAVALYEAAGDEPDAEAAFAALTDDSRLARLRSLAIAAYWAARTPTEAKMAGILMDLFAPDISYDAERGDA